MLTCTQCSRNSIENNCAKKAGVPSNDLTCIYTSLVRSGLEYSSVLWSNSIPEYLCGKLEMIQKRAMRIIFNNCVSSSFYLRPYSIFVNIQSCVHTLSLATHNNFLICLCNRYILEFSNFSYFYVG